MSNTIAIYDKDINYAKAMGEATKYWKSIELNEQCAVDIGRVIHEHANYFSDRNGKTDYDKALVDLLADYSPDRIEAVVAAYIYDSCGEYAYEDIYEYASKVLARFPKSIHHRLVSLDIPVHHTKVLEFAKTVFSVCNKADEPLRADDSETKSEVEMDVETGIISINRTIDGVPRTIELTKSEINDIINFSASKDATIYPTKLESEPVN